MTSDEKEQFDRLCEQIVTEKNLGNLNNLVRPMYNLLEKKHKRIPS
jgi:hypothetical protein